jgi:M6 family metalloprotease-like protein
VSDIFFNNSQTALSLTDFWRENSYGVTTAVGAVALGPDSGWYTLDQAYSDTQTGQIRVAAIQAADGDVDFTQYNRLFLVINGMPVTENYAGKGTLGCGNLSSADGTFSASTSWIRANNYNDQARGAFVTIHEGGHNLGLHHANSREFGALALGEPGDAGLLTEYEDIFSEMGRGRGHYAATHKARLGWLPTQVQTVTSNGGYALEPLENLGGALALKIRRGSDPSKWLWVEYRQPTGLYDSRMTIGYNAWGAIPYLDPADSHIFSGGLIHYEDATTGGYSHLLDFTPESSSASTSPLVADDWKDPPLVGTWLDPYTGMSITTSNPTGASLTVDVLYDPTFCARMSPTVSMTPSNPTGKRGQNVTFTVTVLNNDTASCSARAFDMTSSLPGGWSTAFSETPVTIAAGAAASVSMTKTVPSDAALTTYSVNATATNGSNSGTGTASVTVKPGK